jgi:hypothetical protein
MKVNNKGTSATRIWRAYAVALLVCMCVTAFACGIAAADVNTRTIVGGSGGAVAAGSQNENSITLSVDEKTFSMNIPDDFRRFIKLIPAPLGNIIALPECIAELIESYI